MSTINSRRVGSQDYSNARIRYKRKIILNQMNGTSTIPSLKHRYTNLKDNKNLSNIPNMFNGDNIISSNSDFPVSYSLNENK